MYTKQLPQRILVIGVIIILAGCVGASRESTINENEPNMSLDISREPSRPLPEPVVEEDASPEEMIEEEEEYKKEILLDLYTLHNGRINPLLSKIVETHQKGRSAYQPLKTVLANNGKFYYAIDTSVTELDLVTGKEEVIYEDSDTKMIVKIWSSHQEDKLYLLQTYTGPNDGGYGDQSLVEIDIPTRKTREIYRTIPGIYTALKFISSTWQGDVLFCLCGGEGGGSWSRYMLLQEDGEVKRVEPISGKVVERGRDHFYEFGTQTGFIPVAYYYDSDSIIAFDHSDENHSAIVFINVFTGEVSRIHTFSSKLHLYGYRAMIKPDESSLLIINENKAVLISLPDGGVLYDYDFEYPFDKHWPVMHLTRTGDSLLIKGSSNFELGTVHENGVRIGQTSPIMSTGNRSRYYFPGYLDDETMLLQKHTYSYE